MPDHPPLEISVAQTQQMLAGEAPHLLVDCRTAEECAIAQLAAAVWIPMDELPQRVAELEPHRGQPLVVLCHHGVRSLMVARWLRKQGFPQAQSMRGGIEQWAVELDSSLPRY